ncbi:MAG: hypothetical protein GX591_01250 [Planctomycetes bacterium]|nr:hypothetical protein [Planctomycetota bacterium]
MKKVLAMSGVLAALAAMSGCGGGPGGPAGGFGGGGGLPMARSSARPAAADQEVRYTVLLKVFPGEDHQQTATVYRDRLSGALRWRDLMVVTSADRSELYWGSFQSIEDARPTLQRAKAHRAETGIAPFAGAIITVLPGSGGADNAWDIHACPGEYSLLVAVFEDQPEADPPYVGSRDYAMQFCRQLREEGYEAYYHHGPRSSSVTVGSFGPEAFETRLQRIRHPQSGDVFSVEHTVATDPALLALQKKFPHRAYNGRETFNVVRDPMGNVLSREPAPSMPVRVPGRGQ